MGVLRAGLGTGPDLNVVRKITLAAADRTACGKKTLEAGRPIRSLPEKTRQGMMVVQARENSGEEWI